MQQINKKSKPPRNCDGEERDDAPCPPIEYTLNKKTILGIFVYLFISKVTTTKVKFRFYKQCSQGATRVICERAISA